MIPEDLRGSGLAVVQTGQALAKLVSSIAFGFLLQYASVLAAVVVACGGLAVSLLVVLLVRRRAAA
jgi:hypothetical protein